MTIADSIRAAEDPYQASVAKMAWREAQTYQVVFHFEDGSSLTFKKQYVLQ